MITLKVGDKAPEIIMDGKPLLESFKGKRVVIYFYPKDDTPGCTAEACNLRDNYQQLTDMGFEVFGVSPDDEKSHQKFSGKFSLPFKLIPDPDKQVIMAYGVWGEKMMYGKPYQGVLRTTFIIATDGSIEKIIEKVDTKNHTEQILKELQLV